MAKDLVTMQTIADEAGYNVSTVSRALRDDPLIKESARKHIFRVASTLKYRPPRVRQIAKVIEDRSLAVLTLGMDRVMTSSPIINSTLNGIEEMLSSLGARLQLTHVPDPTNPPSHTRRSRYDGVFLFGAIQGRLLADLNCPLIDRLRKIPSVWPLGRPDGCWGDSVGSDDARMGELAVDYLIGQGHTHLAFVTAKPDHSSFRDRENGFVTQAMRHDVRVDRFVKASENGSSLPHGMDSSETIEHLADQILAAKPRPTALFVGSDSEVITFYEVFRKQGLRVGKDISILSGNYDAAFIAGLDPPLTAFDIHAHELGRLAAQLMAVQLVTPQPRPPVHMQTEPSLVEGASVKTVPRGKKNRNKSTNGKTRLCHDVRSV